ncbi:MAG: DUF342 domain-containing protein [Deltaproteobacteria bacterium]|nr:DUF342 domain-containing protein [Deltaproteobacteria bacterium]
MSTPDGETGSAKVAFEKLDAAISVTGKVTPDKLKLFLDIKPIEGAPSSIVTPAQITALIEGVPSHLLHTEIIAQIAQELTDGKTVEHRRVAKGKEAVEGRDGKVLLLVKALKRSAPLEFIDPRFIHAFDNVEKGMLIGRVYHPTQGADGVDVYGQPIKSKTGKAAKVSLDKSIILKPAESGVGFDTLIADTTGYVADESGKLSIKEDLSIGGDVNFKTGDIDFIGAVKVKGNVMRDFKVTARKDVTIGGSTDNSTVVSYEGSIVIGGNASASTLTTIHATPTANAEKQAAIHQAVRADYRAAGSFKCHAAQGISVEAIGDIEIEKEASQSFLRTRGTLRMPKGHLFGGEAYVVCGLEAKIIGTKREAKTTIVLCSDIESSVEYSNIVAQIHAAMEAEEMLKLHLGPYAQNPSRLALLKEPLQSKQKKLYSKLLAVRETVVRLDAQKRDLLVNAKLNAVLRVNFHEWMHRGTIVRAGEEVYTVEEDLPGPGTLEFLTDVKKFAVRELRPIECSVERTTTAMKA